MSGSLDDVAAAVLRLTLAHRDPRRTESEAALRRWIRHQCVHGATGWLPHPRAAVMLGARQQRVTGPIRPLILAVDPGDPEAVDAVFAALEAHVPVEPAVTLVLDAAWVGLLPGLEALGLVPRFVELEGTLAEARSIPRSILESSASGLPIRAGTADDRKALLALRRSVFRSEPELGFGDPEHQHPEAIEAGVSGMLERALSGAGHVSLVEDASGIGGFAAAAVRTGAPPTANLMIAVHSRLRGRGVGRDLYGAVLAGLSSRFAETPGLEGLRLIGQTRHPAVQHLSAQMGRWPRALVLRGSGVPLADRQLARIVGSPRLWCVGRAPRVQLRAWRPEHAEALRRVLQESEAHLRPWVRAVQRMAPTVEGTRAELEERAAKHGFGPRRSLRFGIWHGATLVGTVLLFHRESDASDGTPECGYWLHVDHTGRGFAGLAVSGVVRLARIAGLSRLRFVCDVRNTRSRAIPRALGAEVVRIDEVASWWEGEPPVQLEVWELSLDSAVEPSV